MILRVAENFFLTWFQFLMTTGTSLKMSPAPIFCHSQQLFCSNFKAPNRLAFCKYLTFSQKHLPIIHFPNLCSNFHYLTQQLTPGITQLFQSIPHTKKILPSKTLGKTSPARGMIKKKKKSISHWEYAIFIVIAFLWSASVEIFPY